MDDVARCVVASVGGNLRGNLTVDIGGPDQLSYNEILAIVAQTMGRRRLRLNVPVWTLGLPIALMEMLTPRPPINRAMLQLITFRNVAQPHSVEDAFGFRPRPITGNIDHVKAITFGQALRFNLGLG